MTDRHRGYGGFLLEYQGMRVVFAGDTAYTDQYHEIGAEAPVDLAIVPIGAYDPWIDNHASPEAGLGNDARFEGALRHAGAPFDVPLEP